MDHIPSYGHSSSQDTRTLIILSLHQKYIIILLCYIPTRLFVWGVQYYYVESFNTIYVRFSVTDLCFISKRYSGTTLVHLYDGYMYIMHRVVLYKSLFNTLSSTQQQPKR